MAIFRGSRYFLSKRYTIQRERRDGAMESRKFIPPPDLSNLELGNRFSTILFQEGDMLDAISGRASGYPIFWWAVAHFSDITDPFEIETGTEVTVPSFGFFAELG